MSDNTDQPTHSPNGPRSVPYDPYAPGIEATLAARAFYDIMRKRRSVRLFSDRSVPEETIRWIVAAAATAPSGANKQPWRFVAVNDPVIKRRIRQAAEAEEREFYARRAGPQWLADLAPLGTDADKPFLEAAPWIIVVFRTMKADPDESGQRGQVYYVNESVGIATGLLIAAIHHAGLVTLTHTPSPMGFLNEILARPPEERPFLLLPVGYAAQGCRVPDITRKPLEQVLIVNPGA
ncbi:MAG: nitroreductase family protein [Phycisphaerae bacterium]|nr:nitroreductase family protein [Phycisphaerae bacterium]